jgi:DNA-binding GntR family transcriptional regulator
MPAVDFAPITYFPDLLATRSEQMGYRRLSDEDKDSLVPIFGLTHRRGSPDLSDAIPRKGNIVKPISLEDALAVFEVRLMLEPACVEQLAAERASIDEIDAMARLLEPAERLIARRDIEALMNIDKEFHILLAQCARNEVLEQTLMRLHERSLRFWFISLSDQGHVASVVDEHHEIVESLRRRDGAASMQLMRKHIESARGRIRSSA